MDTIIKKKARKKKMMKISNYFLDNTLPASNSAKCSSARLLHLLLLLSFPVVPYGLAVRIPGFHPGGPGSTSGMGNSNFFFFGGGGGSKWHDRMFYSKTEKTVVLKEISNASKFLVEKMMKISN